MDIKGLDLKFSITGRGFGLIEFDDLYGDKCTMQDSSLATEDAIWLGIDKPKIVEGCALGRMHLNRKQSKQLIRLLEYFVKYGGVPRKEE
jgi:hypothetical protein